MKRILLTTLTSIVALGCFALPASAVTVEEGLAKAKEDPGEVHQQARIRCTRGTLDAKACAAGKKMMSIPNNSANPFLKGIIDRMKTAGAELGLEVVEGQNQGTPAEWVQQVELATRDKIRHHRPDFGYRPGLDPARARSRQGRRRQGDDIAFL